MLELGFLGGGDATQLPDYGATVVVRRGILPAMPTAPVPDRREFAWGRAAAAGLLLGVGPVLAVAMRASATGLATLPTSEVGQGLATVGAGALLGAARVRSRLWHAWLGVLAVVVFAAVAGLALLGGTPGQAALLLPWLFAQGLTAGLLAAGLRFQALGGAAAVALTAILLGRNGFAAGCLGVGPACLGALGLAVLCRAAPNVSRQPPAVRGQEPAVPKHGAWVPMVWCLLVLVAAGRGLWPEAPALAPTHHRVLATAGSGRAIYARAEQELQFWRGQQLVAGEGPMRPLAELLATCVAVWTQPADRILVLGLGSGRLASQLPTVAPGRAVDGFDWDGEAAALRQRLQADGPTWAPLGAGASRSGPAWSVAQVPGPLVALARLRHLVRDCIVVGEPLHDGAEWQVDPSAQAALRAAVGEGLVLQPLALDRVDAARLWAFLTAAAAAHPWNAVFAVGDTAVLCSCGRAGPPGFAIDRAGAADQLPETFTTWPSAALWLAHRAHLGGPADLLRACLGRVRPLAGGGGPPSEAGNGNPLAGVGLAGRAGSGRDPSGNEFAEAGHAERRAPSRASATRFGADAPAGSDQERAEYARSRNLAVLGELLQPVLRSGLDQPERRARSLFAHWQALQSEMRLAVRRLRAMAGPGAAGLAQAEAARFLPIGAPQAELQAALGLPDAQNQHLLPPGAASRRAHAIDPTWGGDPATVFVGLPVPVSSTGALEDLAVLPRSAALVAICQGDDDRAVALRARFRSACAEALVEALAAGPLPPRAAAALRELVDPFVIERIGAVCAARGAAAELLGYWRGDLALPAAAEALWAGANEDRCRLLAAAAGRRDPGALGLLARGMLAESLEVRRCAAAAVALCEPVGVDFDPEGTVEHRKAAAERWLSLHNRRP